ncbi:MAG TPA: hypothetical protein VIJ51_16315, partial [Solirubrobacteraceae bacterium]
MESPLLPLLLPFLPFLPLLLHHRPGRPVTFVTLSPLIDRSVAHVACTARRRAAVWVGRAGGQASWPRTMAA